MKYGAPKTTPLQTTTLPLLLHPVARLRAPFLAACLIAGGLAVSPASTASAQDAVPGTLQTPVAEAPAASEVVTGPTQEAAYHFVLAKMLSSEGDLEAADAAFQRALEMRPEEPFLHLEYASHLIRQASILRGNQRQRMLEEARRRAETARDLAEGREPAVWRTLSEIYYDLAQGDPELKDQAVDALERVVAHDPDDLESAMSLGQLYLNNQQPSEAVEIFSRVAERAAANRFVYSLLAEALVRTGRMAEAEDVLARLLALDPTARQVRLGLAGLESERGDHQAALATLREAPAGLRNQAEVQRRIAMELLMSGQDDEARAILDPLYAEEPDSPPLLGAMVLTLAAQGDDDELARLVAEIDATDGRRRELAALLQQRGERRAARRLLEDTLEGLEGRRGEDAAKTSAAVRFQLADLASDGGDSARAAALVEPLTRRGPRDERREITLAYVGLLKQAGDTDRALARLQDVPASGDDRPLVEALRLEVLLAAGRDAEARRLLDEMVARDDVRTTTLAARAAQLEQRYDLSVPILERLRAAGEESPEVLFLLAAGYERTGRRAEATELFEELIADIPNHHPALNYLGYMWAERGENLNRALELVRRAVAAQPDQGSYLDSLGWVHHQLGDHELALGYLQRAAILLTDEAEIQKHLGDVQSALGNTAEARRAYHRALELTESGNAEAVAELNRKLELLNGELLNLERRQP